MKGLADKAKQLSKKYDLQNEAKMIHKEEKLVSNMHRLNSTAVGIVEVGEGREESDFKQTPNG